MGILNEPWAAATPSCFTIGFVQRACAQIRQIACKTPNHDHGFPLVLYIVYSVGTLAPLKLGRRCFFQFFTQALAKALAPLKPGRRAKLENACPPLAPPLAPLLVDARGLLFLHFRVCAGERQRARFSNTLLDTLRDQALGFFSSGVIAHSAMDRSPSDNMAFDWILRRPQSDFET